MKSTLKFILFTELIGFLVCGAIHLFFWATKRDFPVSMYIIISIVVLVCCLFTVYISVPIFNWMFN